MPTSRAGVTCTVRVGELRAAVAGRCGRPCFTSGIPQGPCSPDPGLFSTEQCGNTCDVYGNVAVCAVGDVVVNVVELKSGGDSTLQACSW